MKSFSRCLVIAMILLAVTVYAQAPQPPAAPAQEQSRSFQGALVKIDTTARVLTAKGMDDKEMLFSYTEKTEVVGPEKTIQGLAGKSGAKLTIRYTVEKGTNVASRIEVAGN